MGLRRESKSWKRPIAGCGSGSPRKTVYQWHLGEVSSCHQIPPRSGNANQLADSFRSVWQLRFRLGSLLLLLLQLGSNAVVWLRRWNFTSLSLGVGSGRDSVFPLFIS